MTWTVYGKGVIPRLPPIEEPKMVITQDEMNTIMKDEPKMPAIPECFVPPVIDTDLPDMEKE